mmetsp:Transcript_25646/g.67744  ORF Transcript_25646/g.67744 Transcript_25646/m.67744 type:complete len:106 (+) Transcript_25646:94-411(+)
MGTLKAIAWFDPESRWQVHRSNMEVCCAGAAWLTRTSACGAAGGSCCRGDPQNGNGLASFTEGTQTSSRSARGRRRGAAGGGGANLGSLGRPASALPAGLAALSQ